MGPISIHEMGKSLHREYEAEASRYWHQEEAGNDRALRSIRVKLTLAVSGIIMVALPILQRLAI
jgi:hypothetical protein